MAIVIDGNNTPTAGGVGYGDGTELAFTAAGTSGQPIVSGGASAPAFRPYTLPAADGSANQILQTNGSGALSFATPGGGFSAMDVLTSGVTYTIPSGKTLIKIYVTGGGGGGHNSGTYRGSGAAGGTAIKYLTVTPGDTATIAIGGGGNAGNPASSGGNTTFTYGGVTYTGNGGVGGTANLGGAAGTSSGTGALALAGQGGNGGGPGTSSSKNSGGNSFWGGGGAGSDDFTNGGNYGGGGASSGNGSQGVIVIEY